MRAYVPVYTTHVTFHEGGNKTHVAHADDLQSLCGVPERIGKLASVQTTMFGVGDDLTDIRQWMDTDGVENLCKLCRKKVLKELEEENEVSPSRN